MKIKCPCGYDGEKEKWILIQGSTSARWFTFIGGQKYKPTKAVDLRSCPECGLVYVDHDKQ